METAETKIAEEQIGRAVLDAAFKVHTVLGAGLLESVYEAALVAELRRQGPDVARQVPIPGIYEHERLEIGFRADVIVEHKVLVEIKSVEAVSPLFKKSTTNYLKLVPLRLGFLINFNELHLKDGITRVVNRLEGKGYLGESREGREASEGSVPSVRIPSPPSRSSRDPSL